MMETLGRMHIGANRLLFFCFLSLALAETTLAMEEECPFDVSRVPPDARGGHAYRLVYEVPLSIKVFWQFKTRFDNTFLERNRYIARHRFISRKDNAVVTENRYSVAPETLFRWHTQVFPRRKRLEFSLIDSGDEGRQRHKFHYGYIQLTDLGLATRVTQVAYFDFWGAWLWTKYPWRGGMQDFLGYTAKWECQEAIRFQQRLARSQD